MIGYKWGVRTLALATLLGGMAALQAAAPAAADMMKFKPKFDVSVSIPTDAEIAKCEVKLVNGAKLANGKSSNGWMLLDSKGQPVRRFFDSDGDGRVDIWSYYLDGVEVYREIDSNFNGKPDQYRWLGAAGSKWGMSRKEDGTIDTWLAISPEEVSQEILAAVATKDFNRLQALMVTKEDLDALALPDSEANRIKTSLGASQAKFKKTLEALAKLNEKTKWVHLETRMPQTTPADALGTRNDLVRHKQGTILYQDGDKHDWLQTGELIQVGRAWRIVDAPTPGSIVDSPGGPDAVAGAGANVDLPDEAKPFLDKLKELDGAAPKAGESNKKIAEYNLNRAQILEKIAALVKGPAREQWIRQIADSLNSAVQSDVENKAAFERLAQWQLAVEKDAPGSNASAYVTYRAMSADYSKKLSEAKPADMAKLQDDWREKLTKFVQNFATAEDTPEALIQLGMLCEFMGKDVEAKNWYQHLVKNFDKNPMAPKAKGALERMSLTGKTFELNGTTMGAGNPFNITALKGKAVVVYYWASWNQQSAADFTKMKAILALQGNKVELVCVNLDNNANDAINFLRQNPVPGTHLFSSGGMDSPLANQYGIFVLPQIFVLDPTHKVVNNNGQVSTLDEDLKKALGDAGEEKKPAKK